MHQSRLRASCVVAAFLAMVSLAAESDSVSAPKPDAKVDKALAKPKQDIQRFWVTPEFLMMWSKDGPVHDLYVLRSSTLGGLNLGNPAAQRLFTNDERDYGLQMGGRLTFGMWADDARKWGFELSGFALEEKEVTKSFGSASDAFTGISLYSTAPGFPAHEDGSVFSFPGDSGRGQITSSSQLWGAEGSGLWNFKRNDNMSLDFSFGVKYLDLREDFQWTDRVHTPPGFLFDAAISSKDQWRAHNGFYGAKLGIKFAMTCWDRLLVDIQPAVLLGANRESLEIRGSTLVESMGTPTVSAGGTFTGPSNLGDYDKTRFAVAPEIKLGLGCRITRNISFNANYNFLYVSSMVRPGEQFNRKVNTANLAPADPLVPPFDPQPRFKSSDYWAHGVGVNFRIQF